MKLKISILAVILLVTSFVVGKTLLTDTYNSTSQMEKNSSTYTIELKRWNIYNDGSHPVQTTKGLNEAIKWASENKFKIVYVPAGVYLIDKGDRPSDPKARINMISNMTLKLDDNAVMKKEANGFEAYEVVYISPNTKHVTLKGGIYEGDRKSHDYSKKDHSYSSGTHEFGMGILALGTSNLTIDGVKTENFTGDGIMVGGNAKQISVLDEKDFESGAIDQAGNFIADASKIRSKGIEKETFDHPVFKESRVIQFSRPKNIAKDVPYHIYFYKSDNTFLSSVKNLETDWSLIQVPEEAKYFRAVFDTNQMKGIGIEYWNKAISKHVVIKGNETAFNRRQGITVGGADDVTIMKNKIHHIKGIAPQSGIDVEAGFYPNQNITIEHNTFHSNERYNVILYDGQDVTVENNDLGGNDKHSSIGVAIAKPFRSGAVIKNNNFTGSNIVSDGEGHFVNNKMTDAIATFYGPNDFIEGMTFIDSQLSIRSRKPFGVEVSDITMENHQKQLVSLNINDKPVHLKDIKINGPAKQRNLAGEVQEGSIIDNLKILGFNATFGIDLPRGTYNNCLFESSEADKGKIDLNSPGKYNLNKCSFHNGVKINMAGKSIDAVIQQSNFVVANENAEVIEIKKAGNVSILHNKMKVNQATYPLQEKNVRVTNADSVLKLIIE